MLSSQYKAVLLWLRFLTIVLSRADGGDVINHLSEGVEARLLSPRLDHNGWKPLGHGDPLQNDPTFDYSPPALERVRYWAENNKTREDVGKKNKTDILLLGVSSRRENMKKEQKYTPIRRSYYGGHLQTRLMPPQMQTIQPHRPKTSTTEMHHYATNYPSTKSYYTTSSSSTYRTKSPYDSKYDESVKYVSFTRPDTKYSNTRGSPNDFVGMTSPRKPWVHELLQKEQIKPKTYPPKLVPTTSMKSIFETHPPTTYISTTSTPVYTPPTTTVRIPTTTSTTQKPMYPSYRPTFASEIIYPTVAALEITTESPFKQPSGHLEVSMYQIIEGHSKVKTYGQSDNETSTHQPKIVPITPRQESVVRHVTSHDDSRFTLQVKHLHTKKSTTTTTTTTTTPRPYIDEKRKDYIAPTTQSPVQKGPSMQGLLSLLDSSLGNFFIDEPTGDDRGALFSGAALDTEPTIFVTTTTSYPPSALELGSPRSARQIFDYDQLPESRLKDASVTDFDDENGMLSKVWLRSSGTEIIADGENR